MEVQEAKRQGGERRGSALCEAQPPEDLKHRFLCVLLPSSLHFHLSLSLFIFSLLSSCLLSHHQPRSRTGGSVSAASRDLPSVSQMNCQVQENKRPPKTHTHTHRGKMCLIVLLLKGTMYGMCAQGHCIEVPSNYPSFSSLLFIRSQM